MFSRVSKWRFPHTRYMLPVAAGVFILIGSARAQTVKAPDGNTTTGALRISKIDPPNWYATLLKPMLLVQGEGLSGAEFHLSDDKLQIERVVTSENGHWAQLWLNASPIMPETVQLQVRQGAAHVDQPYRFEQRRASGDGMSGFSSSDVLYLIMPDRFADGRSTEQRRLSPPNDRHDPHAYHGGNLAGVIDHLDYIQKLGATSVWLTPVLQNNPAGHDYHGYGATDMYAVDTRLGTLADYRRLGEELHRRHMKLVFDDVPNHVGPANIWVTDPPMPDWFHGTAAHHENNAYVFPPEADPNAAPEMSCDALDGWFSDLLPDMNQQNPAVAQYLTENMIWWIEQAGIDGLRIDTFPYVQRAFWQQYLSTLTQQYPHLTEVGEVSTGDATVNAFFAGDRTERGVDTHLTTPFDYPTYYALIDVLTKGKPMSTLEDALRKDWLYPHPEALIPFVSNHDQVRFLSQPGASPALLRLGFGLLFTLRGMPQLYAGDEVDMQGGEDPDNRRDFPGGFTGDPADAFTASGRTAAQNAMHDWVASLGALRAVSPALQAGKQQTVLAGTTGFAYVRMSSSGVHACSGSEGTSMLIVLNRDSSARPVEIPVRHTALDGCKTLTGTLGDVNAGTQTIDGDRVSVNMPAYGFEVFSLH